MLRYRTVASAHTFLVAGLGQAYAFAGMKSDAEQILRGLRDKAHAILRFSVRYRADLHRPWRKGTKLWPSVPPFWCTANGSRGLIRCTLIRGLDKC